MESLVMRTFMCWLGALVLAMLPLGCSSKPATPTLFVFCWSDYFDESVLKDFEQQFGCRVQYDKFTKDAELEAKLQTGGGYDVVFPSDRSMVPLLRQDRLLALQKDKLPNLKHLAP